MSVAYDYPGSWTADDVLALPENDIRYEVVDGALIVNPPPSPRHQDASFELTLLLRTAAKRQGSGVRAWEAIGVRLPRGQLLIPDIVVAKAEGTPLVHHAEVLLVVEIVSPGSTTRDRHEKPPLFAEAGIPCYWRVELGTFRGRTEPLPVLFAYALDADGEYELTDRVGAGSVFVASDPIAVEFDPAQLVEG